MVDSESVEKLIKLLEKAWFPLFIFPSLGLIVSGGLALAWRFSWLNPPFTGAQGWAEILAVICLVVVLFQGARLASKYLKKLLAAPVKILAALRGWLIARRKPQETPIPPPESSAVQPPETVQQHLRRHYESLSILQKEYLKKRYNSNKKAGCMETASWFRDLNDWGFLEYRKDGDKYTYTIPEDAWAVLEEWIQQGKL